MIRGIIFDLGSTLMYFDAAWDEVQPRANARLAAFLRAHGITVGDDFPALLRAARERGWEMAEQTAIEHTVEAALGTTLERLGHFSANGLLTQAVAEFFAEGEQYWHTYSDAIPTLQELTRLGLRIGLISNADDDGLVHRAVQRLDLAPYLSPVLSSAAEPRWRKPDPRIFHLVSDVWKLPPANIVMVGDSPRYDILGAHRAGMCAIQIDRGENAPWQKVPDALANDPAIKPDAVVRTLAEITSLIAQM